MSLNEKALVKRAISDGQAFQKKYGVGPSIVVKRHHDHLSTLFSPREAQSSNWPMCLKCKNIVEGYGIAHDGDKEVEIYGECHGEKSGYTIRKPYKDVMQAEPAWLSEVCKFLTFFAPKESDK